MAVLPILVLLIGLMACGVLVTLLVRRIPRQPAVAAGDVPRAVARRVAVLRWAGVTIGAIVGIIAARSGDLGMGLLMAAPLFGLCTLIGVLAGELTVRPPDGPTRTAVVEVRRIRDYLPRQLSRVVAAAGGVLLVLLTVTTAAGGPDDMGRPGRSLVRRCTSDMSASYGPWPGLFYAGRLVVVVLVGLLMAYVAVRTIVRRPRSGSTSDLAVDDALRKRSARVVTGAVGVLIAIPLAGVSLTAAGGLLGSSCPPLWWTIMGWVLVALIPASLVMVRWCVAAVLTPRDRADPLARAR
jgi:hypothetical protein